MTHLDLNLQLPTLDELRRELIGGLSKALRGGVPELDDEAARIAAGSVLDGYGLPQSVREALGDRPACLLLCFDADRIHSWVFGSERVQVASGASHTLDDLNAHGDTILGQVAAVCGKVFSAGGSGMMFADPRADVERLASEARTRLEEHSHGLTFTVVVEPLRAADLEPPATPVPLAPGGAGLDRFALVTGLQGALVRAQVRMQASKDAQPRYRRKPVLAAPAGGMAPRCPSCGRRPPRKVPVTDKGPEFWCPWCRDLRDQYSRLLDRDDLLWNGEHVTFADLAETVERSRKYLAFLAIDGNSMGSVVRSVRTLLELRAFSEATGRIYQAARDQVEGFLDARFRSPAEGPPVRHLSLLSGGDEVTLVLAAAPAPQLAVHLLRCVEAGFDHATRPEQLLGRAFEKNPATLKLLSQAGAGAGLVLAGPNYPVRLLRRYAESLQAQAKRVCNGPTRSALAWTLLTDGSPLHEELEVHHDAELPLAAFERLLDDARQADQQRVPKAAFQRILGQIQREELELTSLSPEACGPVLAALSANYFRYQLARNKQLDAWWQTVAPAPQAENGDAVQQWFEAGGSRRLGRLLELLSLRPFPDSPATPALQEVS